MDPMISKLNYAQHMRLHDAAPDRSIGILAAYDYLEGRVRLLRAGAMIPALILVGLALAVGVVAWAMR